MERIDLTAELIEAFAGMYLSPMYDNPAPTPEFHRQAWKLYCTPARLASVAAPRSHAKSTALTHDYGLAAALFRSDDYICIVSATEELAINHLGDIAKELRENDDLIRDFKIKRLSTDAKTDIVVDFQDGHQCRFVARGSGQKMRGLKWNGKRPGLILCDDLEEDEQVTSLDRRTSFRRWVYRALIPCLRKGGKVRLHGTILHEDALLARTMKSKSWQSLFFRAHKSFDDFSEILWPQAFSEERLREIRQEFIDDQDASGYAQEYLNDPLGSSDAYLRKGDFLAMSDEDYDKAKQFYVGCDFAVSKQDKANRTSFTVGGQDAGNTIHFVDQFVSRWDSLEWIEVMFDIQKRYSPEIFYVEDGVIWKSVSPMIYKEMNRRNVWLNLFAINPTKDKASRGRAFQKRMRAGACRFDKKAEWYPGYEDELLRFTGTSDAVLDDQFDSSAILVKGLESAPDQEPEDFRDEEELEMERDDPRKQLGRNAVTGY